MTEKSELEIFKADYKKLQTKYKLPDYDFLNENFEMEIVTHDETDLILKKIRKQVLEKISSGLRALEMFLNPQNAPLFNFQVIKTFSKTDKEIINELYAQFAKYQIITFVLENTYKEEKEAEFIKEVSENWKDIVEDFDRIFNSMRVNYKKDSKKNDKSYLG